MRTVALSTSWRVAAVLSGSAFVSCGGVPGGGDPEAPLDLGTSAIEMEGTSDSLAVVRDLEVLADGSVWVLNSQEPYFMGFGADGGSLGAHGSPGGGPDEFPMPSAFVAGGWEGEAWVLDLLHHALIRISGPAAEWEQFSLASTSVPRGSVRSGMSMLDASVRTARLGREIIVPRSTVTMQGGVLQFRFGLLGADLMAVDPETGETRMFVALGEALEDPSAGFIASDGGFPLWYRLWASCGENLVRVHDRVRNQLRGFDGSGAEVDPIDLPPVPFTEVDPRQFAGAVFALRQAEVTGDVATRLSEADSLRLLNQMASMVQGAPHELASYLPRYVDFRCGEDGTMWLQPLDLGAGGLAGGSLWLRIAPDGATRDVRLPERFDALRFTTSRIWGVYRDEFDRPSVASIPLPAR
ncbi:hypothetical protein [Candidatus Palauibacter sp.]|uniref:hypothetical protein n=1 Tax=Candidatus Palauibacter sp. TaxID=3101350 RepID=UPI003B01E2C9